MVDLNKLAKPNKSIREHTDDLLDSLSVLKDLNYVDENLYELLKLACEYHDYGKVNDEFQKRVTSEKKIFFDNAKEVAHNVLSLCFINENNFDNVESYYKVCYAVLNHHHNTDNYEEIYKKNELINIFADCYNAIEINPLLIKKIIKYQTDNISIKLKGFLHKCDYAASGGYCIEYKNDFLLDGLNCLLEDWKIKNKSADWNDLQKYCIEKTNENIIVIANTGMGKTEAGLLWIGDNKGFFILPLRTAINAIYKRVKSNIVKDNIDERVSLLHSDSLSYYLNESIVDEEDVIAYAKKGKKLTMPLTISTLDQLFDFVYKYNGFELKLATLSYSKIVIDEIQAYSPDLLAYLVYGLEKITQVGGKFAILTATLPPFVEDYIHGVVECNRSVKFTKGKDRHYIKSINEEIDPKYISDYFKNKGGKVLVVCNTVKKSQEIYNTLKDDYNISKINLIHSKFLRKDRRQKEDAIIEFGKTENLGDCIWVATSIVEASLDIDFDCLFTELNDLNGLFQRLGRINRKAVKKLIPSEPNAYVFTKINSNLLTNERGDRGFIDKKIHELSIEAISNYCGVLSENDKVKIIEEFLTFENIKNSNFNKRYKDVKNYIDTLYVGEKNLKEVQNLFRNISSYNVIPKEVYINNKDIIDTHEELSNQNYVYDKTKSKIENKIRQEKLYLSRLKAKEIIMDYTVSVGIYDICKSNYGSIKIGYDQIIISDCNYSFDLGYQRIENKKKDENSYDNFL